MTTAVFVWTVDDLVGAAVLLVIVALIALAFLADRVMAAWVAIRMTASGALVRLRAKRPARPPTGPLVSFRPDRVRVIGCQREVSKLAITETLSSRGFLDRVRYRLMDDILSEARGCIEITRVDLPGTVKFSGRLVVIVPPGAATPAATPTDTDEHGPARAGGKCS